MNVQAATLGRRIGRRSQPSTKGDPARRLFVIVRNATERLNERLVDAQAKAAK